MDKTHIRQQMRKRRSSLNAAQRLHFGEQFLKQIVKLDTYRRSTHIACYWSLWGELDTRPLLAHAQQNKKRVYLPVIDGETMWFTLWDGNNLITDRRSGIAQPLKSSQRLLNANHLDMVIVPLVGFDRHGMRVGQGGGFYDRFFAQQQDRRWSKPKLFGAAYDFQECPLIPFDHWDVPLAGVVTNCEVIISKTQQGTPQ